MALAMPSRFACLKIEGEDFQPVPTKQNKKKQTQEAKPQGGNKKNDTKGAKKTTKPNSSAAGNNNNNNNSSSNNGAPRKDKKKKEHTQQWEEWKQKDNEFVDGFFEKDLQSAIMLSKLDFEEKKDVYKRTRRDADGGDQQNGKKKKNKAMSLEQFNSMLSGPKATDCNVQIVKADRVGDDDFFEDVQDNAKKELTKEQVIEQRKAREANIEEIITIAQCQQKLEKQIALNVSLQEDLDKARAEIMIVKNRNKTLCAILGQGEMKDKADVLEELERLGHVKDELTEEVSRLYGLLEQERSKVAALTAEPHAQHKHKDKGRKKHGL